MVNCFNMQIEIIYNKLIRELRLYFDKFYYFFSVICFLVFLLMVNGFLFFVEKILNGEFVLYFCKLNFLWKGVGYKNKDGGGERNQFGCDFFKFGKV